MCLRGTIAVRRVDLTHGTAARDRQSRSSIASKPMRRLEVLGWWFDAAAPDRWPRPQALVTRWRARDRAAVLAYLRAGVPLVAYPARSHCRFACGARAMGNRDLTDGRHVWPDGLAHYVECHAVALPPRFVARAVARGGAIAPFRAPRASFGSYDTGPWLAWARARGACLDLDGWQRPTDDDRARIRAEFAVVRRARIVLCRGATREVVVARRDGTLEIHHLRAGGGPPQRLAGWHQWPTARSSR